MNHYYMITVQLAYKKKDEDLGVEDMLPLVFPSETLMNFNASMLFAIEKQAVKEYYERNKIDADLIEKSNSQVIAVSYLGQMETFNPVPKKEDIN